MKDAFNQILDAYTEDNETLVINTCLETGVDPMEMMSWWKAVDPGEFKMGSEDYWESAPSKAMSKRSPAEKARYQATTSCTWTCSGRAGPRLSMM